MTTATERPAWARNAKESAGAISWTAELMENIRAVIADRQLSAADVERITGVPEKRVRGLINDTKVPNVTEIIRYAAGFELQPSDLVPSGGVR